MTRTMWVLALCGVAAVFCGAAQADLVEHLVALYLFDEASGKDVLDSSGNGNDGVIQGGVQRADGMYGGALDFNGKDGFVEIQHDDSLTIATGLTIAMWAYIRNYSTAGGVGLTKEHAYKAGMRDHQKMMLRFSTPAVDWNNVVDGTTPIPLKEWHHLAATYDAASGDAVVYFDGMEDGRSTFDGEVADNQDSIWIGRGQNPYFDGLYDEVGLWNAALTEAEIQQVMKGGILAVDPRGKLGLTWAQLKSPTDDRDF